MDATVIDAIFAAHPSLTDARKETLRIAAELGADTSALERIADAVRVKRTDTIHLPPHRFEGLSRGKGWARKGRGSSAEWGTREDEGYRVGPGKWTVGGNDGFARKDETDWKVEHVQVGAETWTIAN